MTAIGRKISMDSRRIIVFAFILVTLCTAPSSAHAQDAKPNKGPLANLAFGWTYLWADQGNNERISLNGWFARPSVNLGKGYSIFASFTNYYGANHKGSVNSHGFTGGVSKQFFPHARVRPSIFAESGDVRSSNAGTIRHQFLFASGCGLAVPFWKGVALAITPAEWVFLYPNGDPRNDFNTKVGISIPFGRR